MNTTELNSSQRGFTMIELLVVIAIISVLAGIAYPVISAMRSNSNLSEALSRMHNLAAAVQSYAAANSGDLPAEDVTGVDDWAAVKRPEAGRAWYNALPRLLGKKTPADYADEGHLEDFYRKDNILFLPGAKYPGRQRSVKPFFAMAINTKLHRNDLTSGEADPQKRDVKIGGILIPARTVMFVEQGLPDETPAHPSISASADYDGTCKGSAKSFVARYRGKGVIAFADGHTELVVAKDILTQTGAIIWDPASAANGSLRTIWTPDPAEDPN